MSTDRKTILCVDDEPNILSALKRLLRKEDVEVLTATSAREGLDLLTQNRVHLVISDQRMPEVTGVEFLQKVKQQHPDTIRIVLSGFADTALIVDSINKGEVYRFLTKPWDNESLKAAIRQCLEQYDLLEHNRKLVEQIQVQNDQLSKLNRDLEHRVAERTRTLSLSQEILEKLPVPVVGVSPEGMVVLTNEKVRELFPSTPFVMGSFARTLLPGEVAGELDRCLGEGRQCRLENISMTDRKAHLRIDPLISGGHVRGCIMIMEPQ